MLPTIDSRAAEISTTMTRRQNRRARVRAALAIVERLEERTLLNGAPNTLYVELAGNFSPANPSSGESVTWVPTAGTAFTSSVTNLTFGTNAFSSIQAAVNAAAPGDTIEVDAGTYNEAVTIEKPLTLLGAQANVTPVAGGRSGGESIIGGSVGGYNEIAIEADDVVVNGFEVANQAYSIITNDPLIYSNGSLHQNVTISYNYVYSTAADNAGIVIGRNALSPSTFTNYSIVHNLVNVSGPNASTAIAASGGTGATYNGLDISYNDITDSNGRGIFSGADPATSLFSNTVITYNKIHDTAGPGINIANLVNAAISHNTFTNVGGDAAFVNMNGGKFTYNTISGLSPNYGFGLELWGNGDFSIPSRGPSQNVEVGNNDFIYNSIAGAPYTAALWLDGHADSSTLNVHDNTFTNEGATASSTYAIGNQGSSTLDISDKNNSFNGVTLGSSTTLSQDFTIADQVFDAVDSPNASLIRLQPNNIYVTPNSFDNVYGSTTTPSIQRGIDAASSGDTVNVAAGSYSDNIVLNKQVNLLAAQAGVDARNRVGMTPDPMVESIITPANPALSTIQLETGSAGSKIDGFVLTGGTQASVNGVIESTSGPIDNLQLLNNDIRNFAKDAVFLNDSGTNITVSQNVFDGSSQAGNGDVFHLDTDNFAGFWFTNNWVQNGHATGFFVDGNHNVGASTGIGGRAPLISGNTFRNNITGANLGRYAFTGGTISGNSFSNNGTLATPSDGLQGGIQNSLITQNSFTGNMRSGLALTGFSGSVSSDPTRGAFNNVISENFFSGNGAQDVSFNAFQYPGTIATNELFDNSLGSTNAVAYSGTETIQASGNWWGSITGPTVSTNVGGTGGAVIGTGAVNVDFTPWLDSGTDTDNVTAGFQGSFAALHVSATSAQSSYMSAATSRIQEGVNLVTSGGTVNVAAGTYTGAVDATGTTVTLAIGGPATTGIVNNAGDLTLGSTDTLAFKVNGGTPGTSFDQWNVNGVLTLNNAVLSTSGTGSAQVLPLIVDSTSNPVVGTFVGQPEASTVDVNGVIYAIRYDYKYDSTPNDVVLYQGADLSISASASTDPVVAGDPAGFNYTIVVTNTGPSNNTGGFTVTDVLPNGLTFQSAGSTPGAVVSGQTVQFTNTSGLASGNTETFVIHVRLSPSAPNGSTLSNSASVATNGTTDPNSGNNTSNTVVSNVITKADLVVTVSAPSSSLAGCDVTYTVTIANPGPSDAQSVVLSNTTPANTAFLGVSSVAGWTASGVPAFGTSGSSTMSFSDTTALAAGASATFTIKLQIAGTTIAGTQVTDTASATSTTTDPNTVNNTNVTGDSTVVNTGVGLSTNLATPSQVNLVAEGNTIAFAVVSGQTGVVVNSKYLGAFTVSGDLVAYGRGAYDRITVSSTITTPAFLYGSGLGDTIVAGGGNTVLDAGLGNATLVSGVGHNIMIGGGATTPAVLKILSGMSGNNVMVGGQFLTGPSQYPYDAVDVALESLLAEWGSSDSYATRVSNMTTGGGLANGYQLNSSTVSHYGVARDTMIGGGATSQNWYLASVIDVVIGKKNTETRTTL